MRAARTADKDSEIPTIDRAATDNRAFLVVIASGRKGGNTETLGRTAAAALPDSVVQTWLHLADLPLPTFEDLRHDPAGYPQRLDGNARTLFEATAAATDLVFVAPV